MMKQSLAMMNIIGCRITQHASILQSHCSILLKVKSRVEINHSLLKSLFFV